MVKKTLKWSKNLAKFRLGSMAFLSVFLFIFSQALMAKVLSKEDLDPNKFTICTITINSDQERKIFEEEIKKNPEKYNSLVELTDFKTEDGEWLDRACQSGITCDQLVISGHFANANKSFSGKSNLNLNLYDLEKRSCNKTCEGITSHPYEVFALGCNTTEEIPSESLTSLMSVGLTKAEAQKKILSIEGILGNSNKALLQRSFGGESKQIYGYKASGPSGASVEKFLKKYFEKQSNIERLEKMQAQRLIGKADFLNNELASSLKMTHFTQCLGGGNELNEKQRLRCVLLNSEFDVKTKVNVTLEILSRDDFLEYVPIINMFFEEVLGFNLDISLREEFKVLAENEIIKSQMKGLLHRVSSLDVMSEYTKFATVLKYISIDEEKEIFFNNANQMIFAKNLTELEKNKICFNWTQDDRDKLFKIKELKTTKLKLSTYDFQLIDCLPELSEENKIEVLKQISPEKDIIAKYFNIIKPEKLIPESITGINLLFDKIFEGVTKSNADHQFLEKVLEGISLKNKETKKLAFERLITYFESLNLDQKILSAKVLEKLLKNNSELTKDFFDFYLSQNKEDSLKTLSSLANLGIFVHQDNVRDVLGKVLKSEFTTMYNPLYKSLLQFENNEDLVEYLAPKVLIRDELNQARELDYLETFLNVKGSEQVISNIAMTYIPIINKLPTEQRVRILYKGLNSSASNTFYQEIKKIVKKDQEFLAEMFSCLQKEKIPPMYQKYFFQLYLKKIDVSHVSICSGSSLLAPFDPISDELEKFILDQLTGDKLNNNLNVLLLISSAEINSTKITNRIFELMLSSNKKISDIALNHLKWRTVVPEQYIGRILELLPTIYLEKNGADGYASFLSSMTENNFIKEEETYFRVLKNSSSPLKIKLLDHLHKFKKLSDERLIELAKNHGGNYSVRNYLYGQKPLSSTILNEIKMIDPVLYEQLK